MSAQPAVATRPRGDERPWVMFALCAGADPELFFSEAPADVAEARRLCRVCPVARECDWSAELSGEEFGVWGGKVRNDLPAVKRLRPHQRVDLAEVAVLAADGESIGPIANRMGVTPAAVEKACERHDKALLRRLRKNGPMTWAMSGRCH